jgi:hypothetical protein
MCNRRVCFFAHSLQELRQPSDCPPRELNSSNSSESDLSASPSYNSSDTTNSCSSPSSPEAEDLPGHQASASSSGYSSSESTTSHGDQSPLTAYTLASMLQQMTSFGLSLPAASNAAALDAYASSSPMGQVDCGLMSQLQSLHESAYKASAPAENAFSLRSGSYQAFDQWIDVLTDDSQQAGGWPVSKSMQHAYAQVQAM